MPQLPRIVTTPPKQTGSHQRKASFASPIDIKPRSATMRRMSMSATPQSSSSGRIRPRVVDQALQSPQASLAVLITLVMLIGITISVILDTSLDTSALSSLTTPIRTAYFAKKSNIFNQVFVKKCWGWTSLIYIIHLATAPPSHRFRSKHRETDVNPRAQRVLSFVLASTLWLGFTTWFFGAGLGDRVIAYSGGACAVPLPMEWDIDPSILRPLLPKDFPTLLTSSAVKSSRSGAKTIIENDLSGESKDQLYLPLPASFCHQHLALTPQTHPDLFALLSQTSSIFPTAKETNTLHPSSDHPPLEFPRPRWSNGFDISGHSFLLTLAALVLVNELAPSWRGVGQEMIEGIERDWVEVVHDASTWLGSALLGLWVWMLFMTSIYFHNPPEKITGLIAGLTGAAIVNALSPPSLFRSQRPRLPTPSKRLSSAEDDENSARRGDTLDVTADAPASEEVQGQSTSVETSIVEGENIVKRRVAGHDDQVPSPIAHDDTGITKDHDKIE